MQAQAAARGGWLFGPVPDLLLGCGGLYLAIFAAQVAAGDWIEAMLPIGLLALPILVTSVPHYGATLLRVYERSEDRRAYRAFALWTTLPICLWFVGGVYDLTLGSWLVTLYLTWSPWHYSGQNYGIALMFLHRRGVTVTPAVKRWLYASFALSFAMVFLAIHTQGANAAYAPGTLSGASYQFLRIGLPPSITAPLLLAVLAAYAACLAAAVAGLRRQAGWRALGPALALIALQALWFSLPVLSRATGWLHRLPPFDAARFEYAFLWIAIGHALQYLWVTRYYTGRSGGESRFAPYLVKCLLAGAAVWGVPILLFGPDLLGARAFEAGHALLAAAAVNVHHFVLDGAIWKLRDGRIARVLLRPREPGPPPQPARVGLAWGLVALVGVAYAIATVLGSLEFEYGVRRAGDPPDFARMRVAAERLRWVGRDDAGLRYNLAMESLRQSDLASARGDLRRSLALQESPHAWLALGVVEQRSGAWQEALRAYDEVLRLDAASVAAWSRKAQVWLRLREPERAREALQRALELAPERIDLRERLAKLEAVPLG
jgi:tetratricopeptide (TPR) repeat protein